MMTKKSKTRKEKREERAEKVCQEVRWQIANYGGIADNKKLYDLMFSWMCVAKKNMYQRPK